jgi:hypothetical protein
MSALGQVRPAKKKLCNILKHLSLSNPEIAAPGKQTKSS